MQNLEALADDLARTFDALDAAREVALARSREVVRLAGSVVKAAHRGEPTDALLAQAEAVASDLRAAVAGKPGLESAGFTEMAFQELAEAHFVVAARDGKPLPSAADIGVPPGAFVLGLGDLVGELRRFALDALVAGDVAAARRRLLEMEDVYAVLLRFDYPSALLDVRRKQDAARALLERTRGEVAVATRGKELSDRLDRVAATLARADRDGPP